MQRTAYSSFFSISSFRLFAGLFVGALLLSGCGSDVTPDHDPEQFRSWDTYKGDAGSSSYSSLDQINRDNVHLLQEAWRFHTGDQDSARGRLIETNPIVVDGVMYVVSPLLKVIALQADTGEEIWRFDPYVGREEKDLHVNRGVAYWEEGEDRRILFTAGHELIALHAGTGEIIPDFGENGRVNLKEGLARPLEDVFVRSTSPGIIYEDLIILGSEVMEHYDASPGYIRAYNVRTGDRVWTFHTIPKPGEFGHDTWEDEDAWTHVGGANAWGGMSLDPETGTVFIPTGSATDDFYGGFRKGSNLFANTVLALDARTGERKWHYQTIHHDLWDYDLPAPPNLVTVVQGRKKIPAVAQVSKNGFIYLLDRETGEPLFPVVDRPVPASDVEGEEAWPTQPYPTLPEPFARQGMTEEDLSDVFPESLPHLKEIFRGYRHEGLYTPPSERGTVILPGTRGGAEWGGAAVDPATGWLYINANESAEIMTLRKIEGERRSGSERLFALSCGSCHGMNGEGRAGIPALAGVTERRSRDQIAGIIRTGSGRMPSFSTLSDARIEGLIDYLATLGGQESSRAEGVNDGTSTTSGNNSESGSGESARYVNVTAYSTFTGPEGYQAIKPPWGTLNAVDLNTGKIAWKVTLGFHPELREMGIPDTGTPNIGGPIVTAGGLVFIGATRDEMIRAFDKETGEMVWEHKLPAGGYATPATYEVDGKQYLVIAAGGGRGTPYSDLYIAFSLPDEAVRR